MSGMTRDGSGEGLRLQKKREMHHHGPDIGSRGLRFLSSKKGGSLKTPPLVTEQLVMAAMPPTGPMLRPDRPYYELVIARYEEDVSWLEEVPHWIHVTLYNKSRVSYKLSRPHTPIQLVNRGREGQTMLHHITTHYDTLADFTYFAQGDAPLHDPDFVARLDVEYEELWPLSRTYSETHPPAIVHEEDLILEYGGFVSALGNALAPGHSIDQDSWVDPNTWNYVFDCQRPDPQYFAYAAMYCVPRANITGRSLEFWCWLKYESENTPWVRERRCWPPLNPWQIESIWWYLLQGDKYPHRWPPPSGREGKLP
jgi:hypothetical protein